MIVPDALPIPLSPRRGNSSFVDSRHAVGSRALLLVRGRVHLSARFSQLFHSHGCGDDGVCENSPRRGMSRSLEARRAFLSNRSRGLHITGRATGQTILYAIAAHRAVMSLPIASHAFEILEDSKSRIRSELFEERDFPGVQRAVMAYYHRSMQRGYESHLRLVLEIFKNSKSRTRASLEEPTDSGT